MKRHISQFDITVNGVHVVKLHILPICGFPFSVNGSDRFHGAGLQGHEASRNAYCACKCEGHSLGQGRGVDVAKNSGLRHVHDCEE